MQNEKKSTSFKRVDLVGFNTHHEPPQLFISHHHKSSLYSSSSSPTPRDEAVHKSAWLLKTPPKIHNDTSETLCVSAWCFLDVSKCTYDRFFSKVLPVDKVKVSFPHSDQGQVIGKDVLARHQDLLRVGHPDLVDVEASFGDRLQR